MSTYTENLNLFKIIPKDDAKKSFNFYEILNDNWDKIDNYSSTIQTQIDILKNIYDKIQPIGQPIIRLDNTLFENEVRLEGEEVSIYDYSKLYEIYGNTYGEARAGHFKLPDCRNRVFWGAEIFGYIEAGLPNITGRIYGEGGGTQDYGCYEGAFYMDNTSGIRGAGSQSTDYDNRRVLFDASRSNAIYGNSNTVQPSSIKVRVVTRFK